MNLPLHLIKPVALWGLSAASVVLLSGLSMMNISAGKKQMIEDFHDARAFEIGDQIVSQNATAPEASANMPAVAADACNISLELLDEGNGMLGGTLMAPCLSAQDLVIAHAGMVFTAKTLDTGTLFFSLPALKTPATVDIRFNSGETATAKLDMPDVLQMQRVAVQWPFVDGFAIHAFENGAEFGAKGHIWAESVNGGAASDAPKGGYLTPLGDKNVELPLLAQVFTYGPAAKTDVILEAAVTQNNCDSELTGDLITAKNGAVEKVDMVLAMPACDAVGEFVHLGLPDKAVDLALTN